LLLREPGLVNRFSKDRAAGRATNSLCIHRVPPSM
jgi:hypothetical protein